MEEAMSKYILTNGRLVASRDPGALYPASRLMATLIARQYAEALPRYCRGALLDLGCGRAPLRPLYRDHVTRVTLLDRTQASPQVPLHVRADASHSLPLAAGSFDTIVLSDVLEHIAAPEALWREMHRVLRPDGCVLLNVPFLYWLHETPHDYYRYTEHALRLFATRSGFAVETLQPLGGSLEVFTDMACKHLVRLRPVGVPVVAGLQAMVLALLATSPGRAFSRESAKRFPLGYFMVARRAPQRHTRGQP
jgi:SAM-dependent methyltransferase